MRQQKKKKPDPITNHDDFASVTWESIYQSLRPLDAIVNKLEQRWGVDRLVSLVTVETAAKFGSAKAKLDAAVQDGDVDLVQKKANVMMRAWMALDKEATSSNATPVKPNIWSAKGDDGQIYAFVQTLAEAQKVSKDSKDVRVFSIDEVVRIIEGEQMKLVGSVKDVFADATIISSQHLDDEVPF